MKFHYKGKYNLDSDSLPHNEHMPGAQKFKEPETSKELAVIANGIALAVLVVLGVVVVWRFWGNIIDIGLYFPIGCIISLLTLFPHELLHAVCFKEDVYMYTNLKQGMMFVVGPETMSKGRFIFMSLFPNLVCGLLPFVVGMSLSECNVLVFFGMCSLSMGGGDYYNVYNALKQMPKNSRTYLYGFNSFWYMPDDKNKY